MDYSELKIFTHSCSCIYMTTSLILSLKGMCQGWCIASLFYLLETYSTIICCRVHGYWNNAITRILEAALFLLFHFQSCNCAPVSKISPTNISIVKQVLYQPCLICFDRFSNVYKCFPTTSSRWFESARNWGGSIATRRLSVSYIFLFSCCYWSIYCMPSFFLH